jgi:hypothetical protein
MLGGGLYIAPDRKGRKLLAAYLAAAVARFGKRRGSGKKRDRRPATQEGMISYA